MIAHPYAVQPVEDPFDPVLGVLWELVRGGRAIATFMNPDQAEQALIAAVKEEFP